MKEKRKRWIVAITGASGSVYGVRLIQVLLQQNYEVHLIVSAAGYRVLACEMGIDGQEALQQRLLAGAFPGTLIVHETENIAAAIASGSFHTEGMVISPCSMGTLAAVSQGLAQNLITRSADVCLKERRKLVLVVRETPLHSIHLENMLRLSRMGAIILPAMPAFYQHPRNLDDVVDFITGRTLDMLNIENQLFVRYGEENEQTEQ